jgi:hypothetical protein
MWITLKNLFNVITIIRKNNVQLFAIAFPATIIIPARLWSPGSGLSVNDPWDLRKSVEFCWRVWGGESWGCRTIDWTAWTVLVISRFMVNDHKRDYLTAQSISLHNECTWYMQLTVSLSNRLIIIIIGLTLTFRPTDWSFLFSFYRKTSLKKSFCRHCDDLSVAVCYSVCLSRREP